MKCLAAQAAYQRKEKQLTTEYGMWLLEWCDTVFGVVLAKEYGFGQTRLQRLYDNNRTRIVKEVSDNIPDRMFVDDGKGRRRADENARLNDGVDNADYRAQQQLKLSGLKDWQFEEIEPEDKFGQIQHHKRNEILSHAARKAWYEMNGKRAIRVYVAHNLLYMRDEYKYGVERLNRLYELVAPYIKHYLERFLLGDIREDDKMRKELDEMHEKLVNRGIELEEVMPEDAVKVKRAGAETVQITSNNEISDYNKIMQEVKKQNLAKYRRERN